MALPDLDDLIAEVDRTCANAHPSHPAEQPDWLALLRTAAGVAGQLQAQADQLVEDYIDHCRMHGYSWTEVGKVLGVTRQAVQQRFDAPHKRYGPDVLTPDLQAALAQTKKVAVQHRNNYIGTEHLFWGLTAQDNSATRLLREAGASPEQLHVSIENRLRFGASQAAVRIAWTPYARKAIAIAEERATQAGATLIHCSHLLLGLAQVGRGVATAVLADAGLAQEMLDDAATKM